MTSQTELKVLTLLRSAELTKDLKTEHLKKLAAAAKEVTFSTGEIIYEEGEQGQAVYLINYGQVVIEVNVPGKGYVAIHTLGPDELFGWSALFPSERKGSRARALEATRAIAINAEQVRAAWEKDHTLESAMIQLTAKIMIDRLKSARQQLKEALAGQSQ